MNRFFFFHSAFRVQWASLLEFIREEKSHHSLRVVEIISFSDVISWLQRKRLGSHEVKADPWSGCSVRSVSVWNHPGLGLWTMSGFVESRSMRKPEKLVFPWALQFDPFAVRTYPTPPKTKRRFLKAPCLVTGILRPDPHSSFPSTQRKVIKCWPYKQGLISAAGCCQPLYSTLLLSQWLGTVLKHICFSLRLVWSLFAPLLFFQPFSVPVLLKEGAGRGDTDEPCKARIGCGVLIPIDLFMSNKVPLGFFSSPLICFQSFSDNFFNWLG